MPIPPAIHGRRATPSRSHPRSTTSTSPEARATTKPSLRPPSRRSRPESSAQQTYIDAGSPEKLEDLGRDRRGAGYRLVGLAPNSPRTRE